MPRARAVGFLHTSAAHVATFDALLAKRAPGVGAVHRVDVALLALAARIGAADPAIADAVAAHVSELATHDVGIVLCTCSTIGAIAEHQGRSRAVPVLRVDRPMARVAVALGEPITIVATMAATVASTKALLREEAGRAGIDPELSVAVTAGAWELFEVGALDAYHRAVARTVDELDPGVRVVVLAQASMAPAAALVSPGPTVLASPLAAVDEIAALLAR
jgi:hypothetical protein